MALNCKLLSLSALLDFFQHCSFVLILDQDQIKNEKLQPSQYLELLKVLRYYHLHRSLKSRYFMDQLPSRLPPPALLPSITMTLAHSSFPMASNLQ